MATKKSIEATGGGSPNTEDDEMESDSLNNRITNIIGESVIFGVPNVDEYGVSVPFGYL